MVRVVLTLLFACASCFGQFIDQAFLATTIPQAAGASGPNNPTNIPGFNCLVWYRGSSYVTNAGVPTMTDLTTNHWNATNLTGVTTSYPIGLVSGPRGSNALSFAKGGAVAVYVMAGTFTNTLNPIEFCAVLSVTNNGNGTENIFCDGNMMGWRRTDTGATNADVLYGFGSTTLVSTNSGPTNHYVFFDGYIIGANSAMLTNTVQETNGTVNYTNMANLVIGANTGRNAGADFALVEMFIFGNGPIPGTNLVASNSVYAYVTNTYGAIGSWP